MSDSWLVVVPHARRIKRRKAEPTHSATSSCDGRATLNEPADVGLGDEEAAAVGVGKEGTTRVFEANAPEEAKKEKRERFFSSFLSTMDDDDAAGGGAEANIFRRIERWLWSGGRGGSGLGRRSPSGREG
jgi:hypothetical protein